MRITGAVLESTENHKPYESTRPLNVCELDLEGPGPEELLIEVEATGVCHSDLSVVDGTRPRQTPMLLGHETTGHVLEVGSRVTEFRPGQRVIMAFLPRCGVCAQCRTNGRLPCANGSASNSAGTLLGGGVRLSRGGEPIAHHLGVSGFATHAVVHQSSATAVDDDLPPEVAAILGCAVLTGGGAVLNSARPTAGQTVAVVGLGGVGLAAVLTALSLHGVEVVGLDMLEHKLSIAKDLGATRAMTPAEAIENGFLADIVIEAAGSARAFETALNITAPGGLTVATGLSAPDARASISPLTITAGARTVVGSYLGSSVPQRDIPILAQLWRDGRLPIERLVSSRIGLDQVNEAMDALSRGAELRQVIIF